MKYLDLLILIFLQYVFAASDNREFRRYKNYKSYSIHGEIKKIEKLRSALLSKDKSLTYSISQENSEFIVAPHLERFFKQIVENEGINATLLFDDISKIIELEKPMNRLKKDFSWTAYYDIDDINNYLTNMSETFPQWAKLIVGGRSYQGRPILGLQINTFSRRNVSKPAVFIESGIHAREWIAPATTTYFINQLLTSGDQKIISLRNQFDWRIFPSVNPDGYHYSYTVDRLWRKTVSRSSYRCFGADPNRNWDYNWGQHSSSKDPCDYQTYAGSRPFSEIETRTLSTYIRSIDNLMMYISFHSYAAMLFVPFSDSTKHVQNYADLVRVGTSSLQYGYNVHKNQRYKGPATAAELLYKASGGSMDWVRHALGIPLVYTYELRGNSFHWPPSRIEEQGEEVTQMILGLSTEANKLGYFF